METKYFVYEITSGMAYYLVFSFLAMVGSVAAALGGLVDPMHALLFYVGVDAVGSAALSGRRQTGTKVEVYGST